MSLFTNPLSQRLESAARYIESLSVKKKRRISMDELEIAASLQEELNSEIDSIFISISQAKKKMKNIKEEK